MEDKKAEQTKETLKENISENQKALILTNRITVQRKKICLSHRWKSVRNGTYVVISLKLL